MLWDGLKDFATSNKLIKGTSDEVSYFTVSDAISCELHVSIKKRWVQCFFSETKWRRIDASGHSGYLLYVDFSLGPAQFTKNQQAINTIWIAMKSSPRLGTVGNEEGYEIKEIELGRQPSRSVLFTEENRLQCRKLPNTGNIESCSIYNRYFQRQL